MDIDIYKLIIAVPAALLAIFVSFYPLKKRHMLYYFLVSFSWFSVGYAISLRPRTKSFVDFDIKRALYAIPATLAIAASTILLTLYDKRYKHFYYYYVIAIILIVFGKAGIIIVELGLFTWEQMLTVFSTALVVIGGLISVLNLKGKKKKNLLGFGRFMLIGGWILFAYNISHNPKDKNILNIISE